MATWLILVWTVQLLVHACMTDSPLKEKLNFKPATVGQDINLTCSVENSSGVVWYKQRLLMNPSNYTFKRDCKEWKDGQFQNCSRFAFNNTSDEATLHITDVQMVDSGIYHCLSFSDNQIRFWESITMVVRDSTLVNHTLEETTKNRSSEGWKCVTDTGTFGKEKRVGWFWLGNPVNTEDFYCHGERNSKIGIYHCTVTPCKQTPTCIPPKEGHEYVVFALCGALVFSVILVLGLAFCLYNVTKKLNSFCAELDRARASVSSPNREDQDEDNLHYAAVRLNPVSKQRKPVSADCVYSTVQTH